MTATDRKPTAVEYAAQDLRYSQERVDEHKKVLQRTVKDAWDTGVPVAVLARQAGVKRDTIYAWLEQLPPEATS